MTPFTLAHLSDPHLAPMPKPRLIELAGKRALGYVNWTRNRHKDQRREVLDALVAHMNAQAPDHTVQQATDLCVALARRLSRPLERV